MTGPTKAARRARTAGLPPRLAGEVVQVQAKVDLMGSLVARGMCSRADYRDALVQVIELAASALDRAG